MMKVTKLFHKTSTSLALFAIAGPALVIERHAFAEDSGNPGGIEEVIVTAQRTSESIQEVPIAVTALTGDMLEYRQIQAATDLQLNTPNVTFTATNFGGSSFSIRGIGRLVIAASGENGISTHVDDIPFQPI